MITGEDCPSFDGGWNKDYHTSTWFSPQEFYDKNNKCEQVAWSGYDWQYTNERRRVIRHENRWQFKDDDLNPIRGAR